MKKSANKSIKGVRAIYKSVLDAIINPTPLKIFAAILISMLAGIGVSGAMSISEAVTAKMEYKSAQNDLDIAKHSLQIMVDEAKRNGSIENADGFRNYIINASNEYKINNPFGADPFVKSCSESLEKGIECKIEIGGEGRAFDIFAVQFFSYYGTINFYDNGFIGIRYDGRKI